MGRYEVESSGFLSGLRMATTTTILPLIGKGLRPKELVKDSDNYALDVVV